MLTTTLKNKIQTLWDRLWAGGLTNPITAIEQISYLLFMKRLEKFKSDCPDDYKWSNYFNYPDKKLSEHLTNKVFPYIQNELTENNTSFAKAMKDAKFSIKPPSLLKDAVGFINDIYEDIELQEKENNQYFHDIQGDLYEHLLSHTGEAGKNGQFRTPRHIIQMMVEILNPKIDGRICDLASGSGGFLVGAFQYIITKNSEHIEKDDNGFEKGLDGNKLTSKQIKKLKENTFFGFDVDETMVRLGMMNLMMHGITHPNIQRVDTLSLQYEALEAERLGESFDINDKASIKNPSLQGQYKYILANPPFTGKINSKGVSENLDRVYPPKYKNDERVKQTVSSELLFLERMTYMLEIGGTACVIVPEGVLFNSGKAHKHIREILMTDCDLQGVISMPSGVFQPYTGVKTSILIFKKRKFKNGRTPENAQNIDVWFYGMTSDGFSLDTNRKRLKNEPLPKVVKMWRNRNQLPQADRQLEYFSIPFAEIKKNGFELNFNLYQDFKYEPQEFKSSKEILKKIQQLEEDILSGLKELA